MPHSLDQERPIERLVIESVGELEPGRILRLERLALARRKRRRVRNAAVCLHLRGPGRLDGSLRHLLISGHSPASDKSGFMFARRDSRVVLGLLVDADDKMRLARALLGDKE